MDVKRTGREIDWNQSKFFQRQIVTKYIYFLSICTLLEFCLETYDFNFTTFERQILYFSLHYISIKALEVESRYYVAALKDGVISSRKRGFLFFRHFISNHSCRATWSDFPAFYKHWPVSNIYLQQFNNKKLILGYILDTVLSDFAKLCKWKYYL